ncbi:MAG: hypothetical protein H6728_06690 [Myxococcales bacterium]|nr:hypothetical protein [Myxococcales bacterium]
MQRNLFSWLFGVAFLCLACIFAQDAHAKDFRVVVVGAKILPTKDNGACWDFCFRGRKKYGALTQLLERSPLGSWKSLLNKRGVNGATALPDAYAIVRFSNGLTIRTHKIQNSLVPEWGSTEYIALRKGMRVDVEVWDADLRKDDLIGQRKDIPLPEKLLQQGGTWTIRVGRALEFSLFFVRDQRNVPRRGLRAGLYEITVRSALIDAHNNGKPWDIMNGKPDPYVLLKIGTKDLKTPVLRDTLTPQWHATYKIYLTGRESLSVSIFDHDGPTEQLLGECSFSSIEHLPLLRRVLLKLQCDHVKDLKIHFRRIR